MMKLGVFGATALSLSLAILTPALAQQPQGNRAGVHAGGNMGGARMGSAGPRVQSSNFRGSQGNVGAANVGGRNAQFVQGANRGGQFRGDRGRGYGRDIAAGAIGVGIATGAAIAYGNSGYYGDSYYDPNDSYAYEDGTTYDTGVPVVTFGEGPVVVGETVSGDASSCAQRYRSYDPASGTYLGFDGLRHPCM
jgi:BA14K-like protein